MDQTSQVQERVAEVPNAPAPPEFVAVLLETMPALRSYARHLGQDESEASDLVQETCRRALEAHRQFVPGTHLIAWLRCILRNLNYDRLRRSSREQRLGQDDLPTGPDLLQEGFAAWKLVSDEELKGALEVLPPMYATIYALRVVEGLSYTQIGQRLGIGSSAVGTRLRRTRLRLRSALSNYAAA